MRILVFSWKDIGHPWAGGSEVNIQEQAARWVKEGNEVTMFTSRFRGMKRRENIEGMEIFRAGGRFTIYLLAPFFYLLALRNRADVVLDIINGIPFFTPLFSRKPIVGLIHHVHRDMFLIELGPVVGRFGRFIEQYVVPLLYRNRTIICVSESTASAMRLQMYRGTDLDIRIVNNGISLDHFQRGSFERFEQPTVLYLGRLKKYKQLPRLIAMMPRVREKVPDARLMVVGSGDAVIQAQESASRLGASDYVSFTGFVDEEEKSRLYQQAWVLATASMVEGWGLTVIEANACGTPAVAFDVPGLNESIVHRKTGLLAKDDDEFVQNLIEVLSDSELRESLGSGAIEWSGSFDWDTSASKTLQILTEAVSRSAP